MCIILKIENIYLCDFADIDECESVICGEMCVDTEGSYYCACNESGYEVVAESEPCEGQQCVCVCVCVSCVCISLRKR